MLYSWLLPLEVVHLTRQALARSAETCAADGHAQASPAGPLLGPDSCALLIMIKLSSQQSHTVVWVQVEQGCRAGQAILGNPTGETLGAGAWGRRGQGPWLAGTGGEAHGAPLAQQRRSTKEVPRNSTLLASPAKSQRADMPVQTEGELGTLWPVSVAQGDIPCPAPQLIDEEPWAETPTCACQNCRPSPLLPYEGSGEKLSWGQGRSHASWGDSVVGHTVHTPRQRHG